MRSIILVPVLVVGMILQNLAPNNGAPIASSAAIDETNIQEVKVIPEPKIEYRGVVTKDQFFSAISQTDWPSELWPYVWMIGRCEATGPDEDTVNQSVVGDGHLTYTGPSVGVMQINLPEHPEITSMYDVFELHGNLQGGYIIYQQAEGSWWPWYRCAIKNGLFVGR